MDREVSSTLSRAHQAELVAVPVGEAGKSSDGDDPEYEALRAEMRAETALWEKLLSSKEGVSLTYAAEAPTETEHLTR